jgi:GTPase SAR1 family protein
MTLQLKINEKPHLKIDKMVCDTSLDDKLDKFEITHFLNEHSANIFLGKPKSGKTTLLNAFFSSKDILKGVFHDIYLFQPSQSQASMEDNIWEKGIKDKNKFTELTIETLTSVLETIKQDNSEYKAVNSCLIFDDMTAYLQENRQIITLLKDIIFNRRHYRVSIFFLVQSIKSVPLQVRMMLENLFIFRVSKNTMSVIFEEYLEIEDKKLIGKIVKFVYDKPHNFLFIYVPTQQLFKNWDEIIME